VVEPAQQDPNAPGTIHRDAESSAGPANGWTNILTENFEGDFPGATWALLGDPTWGKESHRAHNGSSSAYCAAGGASAVAAPGPYPNDMDAWMIYGPFDLSDASDAELLFYRWNKSEPENDGLIWGASTNGSNYYGRGARGDSGGWQSVIFDLKDVYTLGDVTGEPEVWIGFYFESDESTTDEGAYVDDIVLRKVVDAPAEEAYVYLPLVVKTPPSTLEDYGVVMGKVTDTGGSLLSGVTVAAGGRTGQTNDQGWFSLSNVAEGEKVLVTFTKSGYAPANQLTRVRVGASSFVEAVMGQVDVTDTIDATTGGTAGGTSATDGGALEIGPNSLVNADGTPFNGTASVALTVFDPSDPTEADAFPGDYVGINSSGEDVLIKSFGFMDLSVTGGGNLQLAPGKTATVRIPVPDVMQAEAQNMGTIPFWHFDTETGDWREEGQGTYDAGSGCFVGTIPHFSVWNNDSPVGRAWLHGRVVDSLGNPVQCARVKCWGRKLSGGYWDSGETCTPSDGTFDDIPVAYLVLFNCQASKGDQKSEVYTFGPYDRHVHRTVGDLIIPGAAGVSISLTWGENPRDLDSHLTTSFGDPRWHLYYNTRSQYTLTAEPYMALDTDDQYSYGPEVTSIASLREGTYRFSVRHYAGTGTIETSGAEVNVVIDGEGIRRYTPPTGQPADTNIWRVMDIVVDAAGDIRVNRIDDYVQGGDTAAELFP
jgi:hypothetical protein